MSVGFVRPSVSDLMFHLYERSLHPELFDIRREGRVSQPDYTASIRICDTGHTVTFKTQNTTLTELVARRGQELPDRKEKFHRRLKGCRDETIECGPEVTYHVSYQVEKLPPDVFLTLHEELQLDCQRAPISHSFGSANRLSPAALSFIQTDVWPHSLLIHAFHTYPEDCAIVKTQSLFEL